MKQLEVPYGNNFKGTLFLPEGEESHPCLILFPAFGGKDNFILKKCEEMVETLGIATFAADYYGDGKVAKSDDEASQLMAPLFIDRAELQKRTIQAFEAASNQASIKTNKIGAIGFCFGGLAAIELLRSGTPIAGVAAFHPTLATSLRGTPAKLLPLAPTIKAPLLILHGYLDTLTSPEDLDRFQKELSQAHLNWQMNIYGQAMHAFTNPDMHDPATSREYNQEVSMRAFAAMSNFFLNIL